MAVVGVGQRRFARFVVRRDRLGFSRVAITRKW
jgi:hypothetical protein